MGRWISDNTTRTRNWIATALIVAWLTGAVAVWVLYRERLPPDEDMRRILAGIVLGTAIGIGVSLTFLSALFRRLFGWKWKEMDFAKYHYQADSSLESRASGAASPRPKRTAQPIKPKSSIER